MLLTIPAEGKSGYSAESLRALTKTVRVMQLTAAILLGICLQVSASGLSQSVTFSGKDVPLENVLESVKKQTGYFISYKSSQVVSAKPVTIDATNLELKEFLIKVLKDQPLDFLIKGKTIFIRSVKDNKDPVFIPPAENANPIKGVIRDAEGNPLGGINIVVKGTKRGVVSDAYGNFMIDAKVNEVLVISSINYDTKEIKVAAVNTSLVIALEKRVSKLDEVEYIAYGTTSKRFNTSVTSTITAKDIENQPINNPLLALQGRVPGTTILQANGLAGGGVTIRVQGRNNLDANLVGSDPFIVIDGVPYASQNLSTFKGGNDDYPILGSSSNDNGSGPGSPFGDRNFGSPLAYINPTDIESITVLRDADATAIYGSRAANGAILITTKKGKKGDIKTDINFQQGFGQV
ncbi:MAG: TonB-dependent receptor plug domain-containing protein, partial [Chitinophagaceae bacterium]|nr:TonB-dependent receptor plug domain-containing protein [Chitinophagaceae bacterium]